MSDGMRLSSFPLVCVGVQILWSGAKALLAAVPVPRTLKWRCNELGSISRAPYWCTANIGTLFAGEPMVANT